MSSLTPPASPFHRQDIEMVDDFDSPLLPFELDDVRTRPPACFQCGGEVYPRRGLKLYQHFVFHERGPLRSGAFDRMLNPQEYLFQKATVRLFGYPFPCSVTVVDRMDKLFSLAMQLLGEIEHASDQGNASLCKRQELVTFLEYVRHLVEISLPESETERRKFLRSLTRNLHVLLVNTGRILEGATNTTYTLTQLGTLKQTFHQRLDVAWYLLSLFHSLTTSSMAAELPLDLRIVQTSLTTEGLPSIFDQLLSLVLYDLVSLAVPVFEKLSPAEWLLTSLFACGCVMELWTLLVHLLQYRRLTLDTESLWMIVHHILQTLDFDNASCTEREDCESNIFVLRISPRPSMPQAFSLWLTTHLTHLFTFGPSGNLISPDPTDSGFFTVHVTMDKLLKFGHTGRMDKHSRAQCRGLQMFSLSISSKPGFADMCSCLEHVLPWLVQEIETQIKEDAVRACLRCCLSMASVWPPTTQLLTVFWEHFSRRLNNRFQLHSATIEGLAMINKSPSSLVDKCRKWCSGDDASLEHDCSFHLFLHLLANLLSRSHSDGEWRQMKGRFFSKFHQRRMQELTDIGLHNMTCLFICLALCSDAEEVARKLLALYDMLDPTSSSSRLREQVWCGALAMAQILVRQGKDIAFLAEKLSSFFSAVARQLSGETMNHSQKQELSPLLTLYVDGVRDVAELSQLEGAEYSFINEGLGQVLRCCGDSQMRHILSSLDAIILRMRCLVNSKKQTQPCLRENQIVNYVALADRLWLHVFPFVCDHALTLTPPLSLADLAASFTHLALDFPAPAGICPGRAPAVARRFLMSDGIHPSISIHYLNEVFGDMVLQEAVLSCSSSSATTAVTSPSALSNKSAPAQPLSQTDIVKVWWKCLLLLSPTSPSLMELTRHVISLPEVQVLLQGTVEPGSGTASWKSLVKAIGFAFSHCQSLFEKQRLRERVMPYFMDMAQIVGPVVRAGGPVELLNSVYHVVGSTVKYCAPVIYLQSKPCPLPDIIKTLVLPPCVFHSDRPLGANLLSALKETLHMFLEGLGQLDVRRDPYIQRQIRGIVTQFLPRFPLNVLDLYGHPVLKLPGKLPHEKTLVSEDFRHFLLNIAIECLRKNTNLPAYSEAIELLQKRL